MKLKHVIIAIVAVMLFTVLPMSNVNAQNGPSQTYAFITFSNMQDYRQVFMEGKINNEALEGVSYDLSTNTLTLNNVDTALSLGVNKMGDDFKIKLIGENTISMICAYGDEYGGSVNIVGDGILNIETERFGLIPNEAEEVNGISLYAEYSNSILTVEKTATVNIKAQSNAISIICTPNTDKNSVIKLGNGQDIASKVVKKDNVYLHPKEIQALNVEPYYNGWSQKYSIYEKNGKLYGVTRTSSQYIVTSDTIVYVPQLDKYILDPTSSDAALNDIYDTEEEILNAGYVSKNKEVTIDNYASVSYYSTSEDANGKKYVSYYYYTEEVSLRLVYEISEDTVTLSDGNSYHYLIRNDQVNPDTLKYEYDEIKTGNFDYVVPTKTLTISPENNEIPEIVEPEENNNVKVEAVENNSEDNAAKNEVIKLINSIVDSENATVDGIDEELAAKIREKINNGETIKVEVVTQEVSKADIENDAKKVEDKISGTNKKIAAYFDIDVSLKTATENLGNVTNLENKITIALKIPSNLPKVENGYTRVYKIIMVHEGVAKELDTKVSGDTASCDSDKFSTYALTYEDVKNESNPSTGDNTAIYIALFALSIVGIVTVKVINKK